MYKRIWLGLMVTVILMAGCGKEVDALRFGTMPTYSAAIYAVGIEQGFFEEAGVHVELTVFRSARDRDGAATSGQLDGFMTDIMGAINLNAKGFPYRMTSREYDDFGVIAGPSFDMTEADIPKTGLSENTVVDYIADTYILETIEKVSMVAVPDRMGALLGGTLDYGIFPQPFIGILMGKGGQTILTTANEDFYPVTVVFDQGYLEDHKSSVEAFYRGYSKTVAYMQSNDYDTYKEALVKYGLATEETVDAYSLPVEAYGLKQIAQKDFDAIMAWMLEKDLLKEALSFEAVTDSSFIQ